MVKIPLLGTPKPSKITQAKCSQKVMGCNSLSTCSDVTDETGRAPLPSHGSLCQPKSQSPDAPRSSRNKGQRTGALLSSSWRWALFLSAWFRGGWKQEDDSDNTGMRKTTIPDPRIFILDDESLPVRVLVLTYCSTRPWSTVDYVRITLHSFAVKNRIKHDLLYSFAVWKPPEEFHSCTLFPIVNEPKKLHPRFFRENWSLDVLVCTTFCHWMGSQIRISAHLQHFKVFDSKLFYSTNHESHHHRPFACDHCCHH